MREEAPAAADVALFDADVSEGDADNASSTFSTDALGRISGIEVKGPDDSSYWNSGAYRFDGAGNIVGIGDQEYSYFPSGSLHEAKVRPQAGDPDGVLHTLTFSYDPFGNMTSRQLDPADPKPDVPGLEFSRGSYDGGNHVTDTGFRYDAMGHTIRYPRQGEMGTGGTLTADFMTPDPLIAGGGSDPIGGNRYTYVRGNPLLLVDPTGMRYKLTAEECEDKGGHVTEDGECVDSGGNIIGLVIGFQHVEVTASAPPVDFIRHLFHAGDGLLPEGFVGYFRIDVGLAPYDDTPRLSSQVIPMCEGLTVDAGGGPVGGQGVGTGQCCGGNTLDVTARVAVLQLTGEKSKDLAPRAAGGSFAMPFPRPAVVAVYAMSASQAIGWGWHPDLRYAGQGAAPVTFFHFEAGGENSPRVWRYWSAGSGPPATVTFHSSTSGACR